MIKIIVIDFGENFCNTDKNNIEILKFNDIANIAKQADLIIASASLEHIPDLRDIFLNLWSVLKIGGFFYAKTPYVVPLKKFLPLEFGHPAHIHDLGSDYWNNLKESYGLNINYISSKLSIIEVSFRRSPFRYIITALLKIPCHLEVIIFPVKKRRYFWPFVGGWEVFLKKNGEVNV
jgi:SAM-dependent methyltransferase